MFNPQMTSSQMELLPLVCLCLLSWSGTTSADQHETVVKEEGSDVILNCSFGIDIEKEKLEWKKDSQKEVFVYDSGIHHNNGRTGQDEQFKGRVSHFQDELRHGNASILIRNTKVADSGDYTCDIPHDPSSKIVHVKLVVGAAPKPSVKILNETETSALLQCEAHGVPEPELTWQDSDGNILPAETSHVSERGGRKYITLNTTVTKKSHFSCVAMQKKLSHTISAEIFVRLPKRVIVKQDNDVILNCSINGFNIESGVFAWKKDGQTEVFMYSADRHHNNSQAEQFKGRISHFKEELKNGNASIKITNATMDDSGIYTCKFPHLQPPRTFYIKLVVDRVLKERTDITGAAPEPYITLHETKNSALLQCEAHGVADLEVHWQDSGGNILPAEEQRVTGNNRIEITLNTTVTKTGTFYCVATQMKLSHNISAKITLYIEDHTRWKTVAFVFIALFIVAVAVGVGLYYWYTKRKLHKLMTTFMFTQTRCNYPSDPREELNYIDEVYSLQPPE